MTSRNQFKGKIISALIEADIKSPRPANFDECLVRYDAIVEKMSIEARQVGLEDFLHRQILVNALVNAAIYDPRYEVMHPLYQKLMSYPPIDLKEDVESRYRWCVHLLEWGRLDEAVIEIQGLETLLHSAKANEKPSIAEAIAILKNGLAECE